MSTLEICLKIYCALGTALAAGLAAFFCLIPLLFIIGTSLIGVLLGGGGRSASIGLGISLLVLFACANAIYAFLLSLAWHRLGTGEQIGLAQALLTTCLAAAGATVAYLGVSTFSHSLAALIEICAFIGLIVWSLPQRRGKPLPTSRLFTF